MASTPTAAQVQANLAAINKNIAALQKAVSTNKPVPASVSIPYPAPQGPAVTTNIGNTGQTGGASTGQTGSSNPYADPMLVGITEAMVAAYPELGAIRAAYTSGDYAGALNALYKTNFYKTTGATAFTNAELKINQPGVYQQTLQQTWLPFLRSEVTQLGLQVSDASLLAVAQKAFDAGLSTSSPAVLQFIRGTDPTTGQSYITGIQGGLASTTRQNIATATADYGVSYNQDWIDKASASVADGATTEQYWTDQIKSLSKSKYAAWAGQIDAGLTMKQIASPYIQEISNKLGIDPAAVTLDDKLLNQGLQGNDPTKPAGMPLWDFSKMVMQDPRWATSKDAMDTLSNVGSSIARSWGVMS
jgi:hypothetical protein